MKKILKSAFWWVIAIVFTVAMARYQKMTGPTYPISGKANINGNDIKYELIRTAENDEDAMIALVVPDTSVKGSITYKRYKSHDSLLTIDLKRVNDSLIFMMPQQPAAGKMMYKITLSTASDSIVLAAKNNEFVVMRFKGVVPMQVLIPHILFMFLGLLLSTRTVIEALIKGARTYKLAIWTLAFIVLGGLILGPIVQKYAFGAYWTGWPLAGDGTFNLFKFGDLTDNKTLVMAIAWLIAVLKLRKDPGNRLYPIIAGLIVVVVYLIPHSMLGSEIDHTETPAK